ncbi:MAG: hypothetical protein L0154_15000 [Chloroflexi bacterium]|nr:hypothetical protein [Chloroflexota bacterium]
MTDEQHIPEDLEPLPDPETPLSDLVDEDVLASDEELDDSHVETRRIRPDEDEFLDAEADEPEHVRGGAEELPPEMVRHQVGSRWTILPLAFGFIGAGVLLLAGNFIEEIEVSVGSGIIIILGTLVLTNLFRFFESGRRDRGLFFIAIVLLLWGVLVAMDNLTNNRFQIENYWTLLGAGIGFAFIITFLFERTHQVGLIFPGILLIVASGVGVMMTQGLIQQGFQEFLVDYMLLIVALIGLSLIPVALRER